MMPITQAQLSALTALIHQLRHDWDLPGINAALRRAQPLGNAAEIATAACRCAANPQHRTPALIAEPGTHWQNTAIGKRQTPNMCAEHPTQPARHCQTCHDQATPKPEWLQAPKRDKHQKTWDPERAEWVSP